MSKRARLAAPRLRSLHIKGGVATRISAHAVGLVLLFSSVPLAAQDNTPPAGTAAGYGSLVIRQDGKRLVAKYNDDSSPLDHWHYEVFDAATSDIENLWVDQQVQFSGNIAGQISAVQVTMESAVGPTVFQKQPDAKLSDPQYLGTLAGTYELAGSKLVITLSGDKLMLVPEGGGPPSCCPA